MTGAHANGADSCWRARFVDLPAGQFNYRVWGEDRDDRMPVVLLHANAGSAASWSRVGPALGDRYQVFALDLRGHGASVRPPTGSYSLREAADDVMSFLVAVKAEGAILVGHSWGAAVALVTATGAGSGRPAPAVSRLVLEDPPVMMSPNLQCKHINDLIRAIALPEDELREILTVVNADWHTDDVDSLVEGFRHADPAIVESLVRDGSRTGSLLPLLSQLTVPTLLIRANPLRGGLWSDEDWAHARRILPACCTTIELHNASHDVHRSQFNQFIQAVREFI
ncbi:alpha/beta fold hydrolase [Candidatus Protofrankia californiensis]|uniref:alpha/beta fold hydrolase n=1 Tax=Candidatus Protofrankia californiensis TaxID=1839754 RepID=UPI001040F0D4